MTPRNRATDTEGLMGAALRLWPVTLALLSAVASGAVGIYEAHSAHKRLDALKAEEIAAVESQNTRQWQEIAGLRTGLAVAKEAVKDDIADLRERMATVEAHH